MKILILFIVLNVLNVIIQTVKSIATIKCGKTVAAIVNAVAYGLYTVVIVYTVADIALWVKVAVVAIANLIGVFIVKLLEEKSRKDKLWKIEVSILDTDTNAFTNELTQKDIPFSVVKLVNSDYYKVDIFAATQKESHEVKNIIGKFTKIHYFISETKTF